MALLRNGRLLLAIRPKGARTCSGTASSLYTPEELPDLAKRNPADEPIKMRNPFEKPRVECLFCQYNITPDYKNPRLLSQFISPYTGKVYGPHITSLCKHQQEKLEKAVLRSVRAGFLAHYLKDPVYGQDPKVFDEFRPVKANNF